MDPEYKYSVIIPTFNRAAQLRECLTSLVDQEYKNFEVIICDDGSTDDSRFIVEQFLEVLNVVYLSQENWGGPARPRNNGIKHAKGEWICFLDSDDTWSAKKLVECNKFTNEYDFIFHDMTKMRLGIKIGTFKGRVLNEPIFVDLLTGHNPIANSSVCVRRNVILDVGMISEEKSLVGVEDLDYWLRISLKTQKFFYVRKELGFYNYGTDNLTENTLKQRERISFLYNKYISLLSADNQVQASYAKAYIMGVIFRSSGNFVEARKMFIKSFKSRRATIKLKSLYQLVRNLNKYIFEA